MSDVGIVLGIAVVLVRLTSGEACR